MILITNFVELINNSTLGWSNALVHDDTAVSMVGDCASTEEIRTYISELCRAWLVTKAAARLSEAATKLTVITAPSAV